MVASYSVTCAKTPIKTISCAKTPWPMYTVEMARLVLRF